MQSKLLIAMPQKSTSRLILSPQRRSQSRLMSQELMKPTPQPKSARASSLSPSSFNSLPKNTRTYHASTPSLLSTSNSWWSRFSWYMLIMNLAQGSGEAFVVPEKLCSPYGTYPNPLGVTDGDRASFHPVIKFPTIWTDDPEGNRSQIPDVTVRDLTRPTDLVFIVTEEDRIQRRKKVESQREDGKRGVPDGIPDFNIGRYDEDRRGLYVSEMFEQETTGLRTVHVGIDLGGPIGTEVHSFADGIVHSVGYNPELGDYGNVIVIEHSIPSNGRKVWALYGHLDGSTTIGKHAGQQIQKGQVVGRLGDIYENGGWEGAHVHFQISTEAPETHDMPGAVTLEDRPTALIRYPDPRWILGMLY